MGMSCLVKFCLTVLGGGGGVPGCGAHLEQVGISGDQMLSASRSLVSIPFPGVWAARTSMPNVWGSIQQTDTKRHSTVPL